MYSYFLYFSHYYIVKYCIVFSHHIVVFLYCISVFSAYVANKRLHIGVDLLHGPTSAGDNRLS